MNKKVLFYFFMAFAVTGLFMICLGFLVLFDNSDYEKNAEPVRAEIVKIDSYMVDTFQSDSNYYEKKYDVYVTFSYNGELYEYVELNSWNAGMKEGDKINILCNPNNPWIIIPNDGSVNIGGVLILLMALLFLLFGSIPATNIVLKDLKKKKLFSIGHTIEATITSIEKNMFFEFNDVHPYLIYCSYGSYEFKSENIWSKNVFFLYDVGDTIEVLVDPEDYNKYYVKVQE